MSIDTYDICVVDIGSPRLGNIGWCIRDADGYDIQSGTDLGEMIPLAAQRLKTRGMILGLEAPLCVPLRDDLMLATKARLGEGRRPWSAGAGAQVLSMNLPIMTYLFRKVYESCPDLKVHLNEDHFQTVPHNIMMFEALVSGSDKGTSHEDDAIIMANYCAGFAQDKKLPPSILEPEDGTTFLNLAGASLLRCGISDDISLLHQYTPIYKPS